METVYLSDRFDHGVEVLCTKVASLVDNLWCVTDGCDNVGGQRGEAANIHFRLLGDVVEEGVDKTWRYDHGSGVLKVGRMSACRGLLHMSSPTRGGG